MVLAGEIKKAVRFFEEKTKEQVPLLILSGGSALMMGMAEYFVKELGVEVQVANPFSAIFTPDPMLQTLKKDAPLFTVAIGLAMRE